MDPKMKKNLKYIFCIPKTIWFNFKVFPLKIAIKLPVIISNKIKCNEVYKGSIKIEGKIKPFMIRIGVGGSSAIMGKKGQLYLSKKNNAKIIFNGIAGFSEGISIYMSSGILKFGENFSCNKNCMIACNHAMNFGNDVLIGWEVNIRDSDGHKIVYKENVTNKNANVNIGNHVWIGSFVDILKGVTIGDNCVVAYRSCVTKMNGENNKLIGGYPAKIIKDDINWKK